MVTITIRRALYAPHIDHAELISIVADNVRGTPAIRDVQAQETRSPAAEMLHHELVIAITTDEPRPQTTGSELVQRKRARELKQEILAAECLEEWHQRQDSEHCHHVLEVWLDGVRAS